MRPRDLAKGAVAAAAAIVLVTSTVTTGSAEERAVTEEVLQNNPDSSASKFAIHDRLVQLIRGAEDTDITIATYHMNDRAVANELADALKRNVRVRILADGLDEGLDPYKTIKSAIADAPSGSWIKHCGKPDLDADNKGSSCMGEHIMHNKFFLFGKTGGTSNVVVQTSANLNGHSGTNMWNTAYVTPDAWLYSKYLAYFNDLSAASAPGASDSDYYSTFRSKHSPSNGKFAMNVSPRTSGNVYLDVLNAVKCKGNTSGGTTGKHHTIVRVAQMQIAGKNGINIAKRLWELDNQGCYVDIVADEISLKKKRNGPKGALEYLLARPVAMPPERDNYHGPEVREFSGSQCGVHQKNVLIDGHFNGKPNQKIVVTGSHNMNNKSPLYNDEVILRINSASVHEKFKQAFFKLRAGAAITWQTSKYDVEPKRNPKYNCK
ncbi:phospholipase D-like domain-containing protein [Tenggerimyces flavus]|uniref:phospholipase D n=1 Tax=Tenggerimyces flavus TaxID=1708749 RepID=A0ABV7YHM5_9ACTN|nr:phospholipase D-like domain-containing protein [Tenggerimyces flavus]MBM7787953.1 phosphatidylserine/phosphatidylglycerophosphate/cardiolipin synthase-like enzyme [Tenggerimyces flavus]